MRRALSRIPLDTFLVLLVGVVVLAALLPARGAAADAVGDHQGRHARLTHAVDRGSILLIVYAAFSVGMVEHIWSSVQPRRVVAVAAVSAMLLAIVLAVTTVTGRLARLDPGDAIVLPFCGSKKSLASGQPMALVLFPTSSSGLIMLSLMLFHQIQLLVCAVIAGRPARD
jgi:sodium/bile acid cotransporter 7